MFWKVEGSGIFFYSSVFACLDLIKPRDSANDICCILIYFFLKFPLAHQQSFCRSISMYALITGRPLAIWDDVVGNVSSTKYAQKVISRKCYMKTGKFCQIVLGRYLTQALKMLLMPQVFTEVIHVCHVSISITCVSLHLQYLYSVL